MNEQQPPVNQEAQAKLQDDVTPLTEDEVRTIRLQASRSKKPRLRSRSHKKKK
jgi:hypothetical protein